MGLKITLKPRERMIIGGAVITNGETKCDLIIENKVPLLREKSILREEDANTPGRRIYFVIQLMYIDDENLTAHHKTYWQLTSEFIQAAPSTLDMIRQISEYIVGNNYYQALKLAGKLIEYEQEVIKSV
jgi:flagellar biosynthesis repressor protein FlbT